MPSNVLVLGSGGREHALVWKLAQSPDCGSIFAAPGNPGTASIATNLPFGVSDFPALAGACRDHQIDLLVVGPEVPLVEGITDFFDSDPSLSHVRVIGPSKEAARLEGSKDFAKSFMSRHAIPTAAYRTFDRESLPDAIAFLDEMRPPYVLKADGLAAGKGVLILDDRAEAEAALREILEGGKFKEAGSQVVIEEFLKGIELSCFVYVRGGEYAYLPFAKDYKRIGEGDTGLNTGGMGAVSPVPFLDEALRQKIDQRIVRPTVEGIHKEKLKYNGFLFVGLMACEGEPYVIEYNVRMGDPETEAVLPRLKTDLLSLLTLTEEQPLNTVPMEFDSRFVCTVIAVSGGYPDGYEKGKVINGLENGSGDSIVFHAGTRQYKGKVVTSGGRVLAITSYGNSKDEALSKSYLTLEGIAFEGMNYRRDIGFDL